MEEKTYFYRKLNTSLFVPYSERQDVIFIRFKNEFIPEDLIFKTPAGELPGQATGEAPAEAPITSASNTPTASPLTIEYPEYPYFPDSPVFKNYEFIQQPDHLTLEDLTPADMKAFLQFRQEKRRYQFNVANFKDDKDIEKAYFAALLETDDKNLTVKLTFYRIVYNGKADINLTTPPEIATEFVFFDIKKGKFDSDLGGYTFPDDDYYFDLDGKKSRRDRWDKKYDFYRYLQQKLQNKEQEELPSDVIEAAYRKVLAFAEKFTKTTIPEDYSFFTTRLHKMYCLTEIPYEPKLYPVLMSEELYDLNFRFKFSRTDSKVLNHFCKKAHIHKYRVLMRCYNSNPHILLTYMRLHDSGFRDLNLYNRVIENEKNCFLISDLERKSLVFFANLCIKQRGEIPTMNILLKEYDDPYQALDTVDMFHKYYSYIPDELKKDILTDGFTSFNHDALTNISYRAEHKEITFNYSNEQLKLEDDIDGYSFRLPATSYQMCEIGTVLHNCVASYAERVAKKQCTIVYAKKDDEYSICIELRGKEVFQERIIHNKKPDKEQTAVLQKWHERHGLEE